MTPALFAAIPELERKIPWLPLGRFPTRVHRVDGLAPADVELWVKRDDLCHPEYGGNKVRKLEFLLGEAKAAGARRLVTLGGVGSHHVLATAVHGRGAGFEVEAVLFPQPGSEHVREQLLADLAAGAALFPVSLWGVPLAVWRRRRRPDVAFLAAGGSSVTGTLGYVSAGLELCAQIASGALARPDVLYVALGSCGTAAGLQGGLAELGEALEIVAVRVVDRVVANARKACSLATGALERLRVASAGAAPPPRALPRLRVEHRFFGGAYGRPTAESAAAVRDAAAAGLRLETTYTGKAMAALLDDARAGRLAGKRVLFWHTYNAADLSPLLAQAPAWTALPDRLHRYFAGAK